MEKFLISAGLPAQLRTHTVHLLPVPELVSGPAAHEVLMNSQRAGVSIINNLLNY